MEIIQPDTEKHTDSAVFADMINQCCEIRLYGIQPIGDLAQVPFETVHPGGQSLPIVRDWFGHLRWPASVQYRVDMARMPAQCDRERFQGPSASPSLHYVMLKLPNRRPRNVRAFGKLTLPPAEFIHPRVDRFSNGRPVLHVFLRAPPRRRD
jgi:hypothetical protein